MSVHDADGVAVVVGGQFIGFMLDEIFPALLPYIDGFAERGEVIGVTVRLWRAGFKFSAQVFFRDPPPISP